MHKGKVFSISAVLLFGIFVFVFAQEKHKYVGVKKCSMCHSSQVRGNQYKQWLSTKHARAYVSLATEEAKKLAEKVGISKNPQEAAECLRCHVTAFGVSGELIEAGFKKEDGIQCEACHGAGRDYMSISIMKDREKAISAGLVIPTEDLCIKCHNEESPNFKGFDFEQYYKQIAHPRPR